MMQFIILGYVPGTEVRFTFDLLATVFYVAGLVYLSLLLYKEEKIINQNTAEAINIKTI